MNAEKPTEDGGVPEEYAEVYEAMMGLPKEHRVVLYLHYYEGYSLKEIAKMMKINPSTLRSRMSRAKELMKQYLQDDARRF